MKPKFGIIGDYESVVIYKIFGWDVVCVNINSKEEIIEKFKETLKNNYDKIFVVEEVYEVILKELPEVENFTISVISLPGIKGSKGVSKQKYKKLAAIATGIKLE
ncbi:MAG: hypothetical protein N2643_04295 [Endomicrobia bacterium]|nr:hypothetical protein [Endomicrobiia bacterium]